MFGSSGLLGSSGSATVNVKVISGLDGSAVPSDVMICVNVTDEDPVAFSLTLNCNTANCPSSVSIFPLRRNIPVSGFVAHVPCVDEILSIKFESYSTYPAISLAPVPASTTSSKFTTTDIVSPGLTSVLSGVMVTIAEYSAFTEVVNTVINMIIISIISIIFNFVFNLNLLNYKYIF